MRLSYRVRQRLRLLVIAGLIAPALMAAAGLFLSYLAGEVPDLSGGPSARALGLGVLTASASMGLVVLLYKSHPILERALRRSGAKVGAEALQLAGYPVMFVVVTTAAVGEEVLFRGGLQPIIGLVPAALLFGFSHGGWQREMWAYAVAAALSGGIFGWMYQWTQDLWVPITAHVVHNLSSTVLLGKKIDVQWEGIWPRIRLLPDPVDDEDEDEAPGPAVADEVPAPGPVLVGEAGAPVDVNEAGAPGSVDAADTAFVRAEGTDGVPEAPSPLEDEDDDGQDSAETGGSSGAGRSTRARESLGEPLPPKADGERAGTDDGDPPDRSGQ